MTLNFELLKKALCKDIVICTPDFHKPFILQTDTPEMAIGAVLMQEDDRLERPVAYASQKLLPTETQYATIEWECLVIQWAVEHFQHYLMWREFKLVTDHTPLKWLSTAKTDNTQITRWALQPFKFHILHQPGKSNIVADFLSRCESGTRPMDTGHPKASGGGEGLCPRGSVTGGQGTPSSPSVAGFGMGTAHPYRKSPEARANLQISGRGEADKLCCYEAPAWFMSHAYFQLEPAQVDGIIPGHHPAKIKAGTGKNTREAPQRVEGKSASHARCGHYRQPMRDLELDLLEGFVTREGSQDNAGELLRPPAPSQ